MLPATADFWAREVETSIKFRDLHLPAFEEIVKLQHGKFYRKDKVDGPDRPENDVHTYKAFMLPELCFAAPAARITAKRPSIHEAIADAIDAAVESWIEESDFGAEIKFTVDSALSGYAIFHVGLEPIYAGGNPSRRLRPYGCHIVSRKFLIDPHCEKHKYARYMGHQYERDLEAVLANPRLTPEVIDKLTAMAEASDAGDKDNPMAMKGGDENESQRKTLQLVDIFIAETASIGTLALQDGKPLPFWIRDPAQTPFWGPPSGPYIIFGIYHIEGDPLPMGPIQPWLEQSQEKNAHLAAAACEAQTAKTMWIGDANNPDIEKAIVDGKNGEYRGVKGFSKDSIVKLETGTMSNERLAYINTVQERMDRTAGYSDAQRGKAAKTTATESQIVQSNADNKVEWMRAMVLLATTVALRNVLWYFIHDRNVVQKVSRQDPITGQIIEGIFLGGPQPGEEPVDVDDFVLTVDPQSMQKTDNTVLQQRWLQVIQIAPQLAALQQMGFNVRMIADRLGETMNIRKFSEILWAPGSIGMVPGLYPMGNQGVLPGQMGGGPQGAGAIPPVNANLAGHPNPNIGNQLAGGGGFPQIQSGQPRMLPT